MKKILFALFIFTFLVGFNTQAVLAADKTVTCGPSECSGLDGPLFYESNILPGDKFVKIVSIVNNRSENLQVKIYASKQSATDDMFLDVISMSVIRNGNTISSTSLREFLDGRKIDIGLIGAGASTEVKFEALFSPDAGNLYQRKKAVFDLFINVEGKDVSPTPTPTAIPTSTPAPSPNPTNPPFPTFPPFPSFPPVLSCSTSRLPCIPPIIEILKPPKIFLTYCSNIVNTLIKRIGR